MAFWEIHPSLGKVNAKALAGKLRFTLRVGEKGRLGGLSAEELGLATTTDERPEEQGRQRDA